MPRKGKKEVHNHPEEHPRVLRRKEQEKKAREKVKKRNKNVMKRWLDQKWASESCDADPSELVVPEAESDLQANMNLPHSDCSEPGTSLTAGRQVSKPSDSSKTSRNVGNDHTSPQEKPEVDSNPENKTSKQHRKNTVESLQSIPMPYPLNKDLYEGQQAEVKAIAENKRIAEKVLECTKGGKSTTNTSKNVSSIAHRKTVENLTIPENVQQTLTQGMKSLKEKFAVAGEIKVVATDKPKKGMILSSYNPDKREVRIGDEDIQITINVNEGSQVVCKSRRRGEIALVQTVKTCSPTLKGHVASRPEEDITGRSEKGQKTTSEAKCDSSRNSQTVDEDVDHPKVDTVNEQNSIEVDAKCRLSIIDGSERKDSSSSNSEENMQKVCKDLLEALGSTLRTFATRYENHLANSSNTKKR